MHIVLIGSGNVATVLGKMLQQAGHTIVQVYSKNPHHTAALASVLHAEAVPSPATITSHADLYLLAIKDDELPGVNDWMFHTDRLIAHTSGSVSIDVLRDLGREYGVLYPLQTLIKDMPVTNGIPFLIDGNTESSRLALFTLARSVSDKTVYADDAARKKWHLAAVIINNFSNHLYTLAEQYCDDEDIDFALLLPLISEGASRVKQQSAAQLQTGPAAREDVSTIAGQRALLVRYPQLLKVYNLFTESIRNNR